MLPKIIKPSVTRNQTMCSFTEIVVFEQTFQSLTVKMTIFNLQEAHRLNFSNPRFPKPNHTILKLSVLYHQTGRLFTVIQKLKILKY